MNIIDSLSEGVDDAEPESTGESKDIKCQSSTSSFQEPTNESSHEAENGAGSAHSK